ncbi:toxin Afp18-like [Periplaneta americana]|uniref:toxin Afp18-like n=1 Tax=Periplaneta americana TaxID=6978 RepID=UPI0037E73D71
MGISVARRTTKLFGVFVSCTLILFIVYFNEVDFESIRASIDKRRLTEPQGLFGIEPAFLLAEEYELQDNDIEIQTGQTDMKEFYTKIDTSETEFYTKIDTNETEFYTKIDTSETEFYTKIDTNETEFYTKIDTSETEFYTKIDTNETEFYRKIDTNETEFYTKIDTNETEFYTKIDTNETEFYTEIDTNETEFYIETDTNEIDIFEEPRLGDKHIICLETRCLLNRKYYNYKGLLLHPRQVCSLESAARMNPDCKVYLMYSCPIIGGLEKSKEFVKALLMYPNVKLWRLNVTDQLLRSPLQDWNFQAAIRSSYWPNEHASDVLRLLTLWKYGGTYMDLDVIVLKSFADLGSNYIGFENSQAFANGVMNFAHKGVGHELTTKLLLSLKDNFRGDLWTQRC